MTETPQPITGTWTSLTLETSIMNYTILNGILISISYEESLAAFYGTVATGGGAPTMVTVTQTFDPTTGLPTGVTAMQGDVTVDSLTWFEYATYSTEPAPTSVSTRTDTDGTKSWTSVTTGRDADGKAIWQEFLNDNGVNNKVWFGIPDERTSYSADTQDATPWLFRIVDRSLDANGATTGSTTVTLGDNYILNATFVEAGEVLGRQLQDWGDTQAWAGRTFVFGETGYVETRTMDSGVIFELTVDENRVLREKEWTTLDGQQIVETFEADGSKSARTVSDAEDNFLFDTITSDYDSDGVLLSSLTTMDDRVTVLREFDEAGTLRRMFTDDVRDARPFSTIERVYDETGQLTAQTFVWDTTSEAFL